MKVDLPEPDGPVAATNSPCWISTETPRSAWTLTSPTSYVFVRSRTERTGVLPSATAASTAWAAAAEPATAAAEPAAALLLEPWERRIGGCRRLLCGRDDVGHHLIAFF